MLERTNLQRFSWNSRKYILEKEIKDLEEKLKQKRKALKENLKFWLAVYINEELIPIQECLVQLLIDQATDYDPYNGDNTYNFINSYYISHEESTLRIFPYKDNPPEWIKAWDCPKEIKENYEATKIQLKEIESVLTSIAENKDKLYARR